MNKRTIQVLFLLCCTLLLSDHVTAQQTPYNHPELDWFTIETEHFYVHFHNGAERTGKLTAKIAEEIYEPVTELYQYEPGEKVHFIIRDHDDYSNGAAFYYDNKVEIWATAMDFDLRGSHNWLRNVLTHEFTHMIQIGSARKITRRIPAIYLQAIGYESDRRQDVLRGGPNVISSYPIAMTVMPSWFAEGVAQYQLPGLGYDTWDSHRDMILRTATLDDKLLTYNQMGGFGKNSLGNEKSYNHGYAFVGYIADHYGVESLREISRHMRGFFRVTLDGAIKKVTGKSAQDLYAEWKEHLRKKYAHQVQQILPHKVEGKLLETKGIGNFNPSWSPDGSKLAYMTTGDGDFLSLTKLIVKGLATGEKETVASGVRYTVSWSPDGRQIAYANRIKLGTGGSRFYDLYTYDFSTKRETRLTNELRAFAPSWSPDGKHLVFIKAQDGTENLLTMTLASKEIKALTQFENGEQIVNPRWSPDGNSVLFSMFTKAGQDLMLLNSNTGEIAVLLSGEFDSRDASFSRTGDKIYFSWDKTGIFNIYEMDLETRQIRQLTNVLGGAFMPEVNSEGELAFASFTSDGYKIAVLDKPETVNPDDAEYLTYANGTQLASAANSMPQSLQNHVGARKDYDDTNIPDYEISKYQHHYAKLSVLPRAMLDYGTLKLGAYLYSYEVLDKFGFIAGFDMNKQFDYDLFALFEYRELGPTFFLEVYNQSQKASAELDSLTRLELLGNGINLQRDEVRYNLLQADAGLTFNLGSANALRASFIMSRYAGALKESRLSYRYFIGRDISLKFTHHSFAVNRDSEINPNGRFIYLGYDREFNKFLRDFAVDRAVSIEEYDNYNFNEFTFAWKEFIGLPIKHHHLSLGVQAGFIDTKVDSFFNFFGGGIGIPLGSSISEPHQINGIGNRGYPYYSIEGRKQLQSRLTYRFPFIRDMDLRILHLSFDKLFLGGFIESGNAFNGGLNFGNFKTSVGGNLRLESSSFYAFPTRLSFTAAYGLTEFVNSGVTYGKEWRFYFGLTFGYFN